MKAIFSFLVFGLVTFGTAYAQGVNNGLPVRIDEGLEVSVSSFSSDTTFELAGQLILTGDLTLTGDLDEKGSIYLKGENQEIHLPVNGQLSALGIDGGGNKTIANSLQVDSLKLFEGILMASANLTVLEGIGGGSSQSYVLGKLIRAGSGDFFFPLGDDGVYAPITLLEVSNATLGATLSNEGASGQIGYGLLDISDLRHWLITDEAGGFSGARAQIAVINEGGMPSIDDGVVVATSGTRFRSYGASESSGDLTSGSIISTEPIPAGRVALGRFFDEGLREADSLALVNIYNQTQGSGWSSNSGWLIAGMDGWDGVGMEDKRVKTLQLQSNNLTQVFPEITTGLEALADLNLSNNELNGINDLSHLTSLQTLNVANNRLQFEALENLLAFKEGTEYAPQKEVLERIRTIQQIGSAYTIDRTVAGSSNSYRWLKNGENYNEASPTFELEIEDFSSDGSYVAQVTNDNVPGLTLTTRPVVLRVSSLERDSASLIAVYDALVTPQSNITNWKSTSLANWPEVEVTSNRVTGVNLEDKNLSGILPEDIIDLEGLVSVNLAGNDIEGLPVLAAGLPNLTLFDVSGNRLQFDDLEPNASLSVLNYADQQKFGTVLDEVLPQGSGYGFEFNVGGLANEYQWFLTNDFVQDQAIGQATNSSYDLHAINYRSMGEYVLKVSNPLVPGLTLESMPQRLLASADLRFIALGQGDTPIEQGTGYALKVTKPGQPYDSVQMVTTDGDNILFDDLILGDYLIAVETSGEVYLPTYYKNTDLWTEADSLGLRSDREETLQMTFFPEELPPRPDGGTIRGTVESDFVEEDDAGGRVHARRKVKRAGCSVRRFVRGGRTDQEGSFTLVAYVQSDDEGRFEFTDLEDGLYRFNIEYPGIPMDEDSYVEFEIGGDGLEKNTITLQATVTEEGIVVEKIEELGFYRKYFRDLNVYPNPADQRVMITYGKLVSEDVMVRLLDMNGQVLSEMKVAKGYDRDLQLDVSEVKGGVYLLQFVDINELRKGITTFKVFIKHQ